MSDITLAIDPGTTESAWLLWNGEQIIQSAKIPNEALRVFVRERGPFSRVVIEMVACYGMAVGKSVFETVFWIGKFHECAQPLKVRLVYRKDIKLHHCGSVKAKDGNIRQVLIDRIGPQGSKKSPGPTYGLSKDRWSALAIALYDHDTRNQVQI